MTGKQKMAQVVKHFEAIRELFPKGSVDLNIHRLDEKKEISPKVWKLDKKYSDYSVYKRKSAKNKMWDITLFTTHKEEI